MLQSFFGYDSPTNLTISSFAKYADQGVFNTANLTVLDDFGISIEPASIVITPPANGTSVATFSIEASEQAVVGVNDILSLLQQKIDIPTWQVVSDKHS
jgi:hypothetical protein